MNFLLLIWPLSCVFLAAVRNPVRCNTQTKSTKRTGNGAALVGLYEEPERPANAVDFVKRSLGSTLGVDIDALRAENERLKLEVATLQQQLAASQKTINTLTGK